MKHYSSKQNSTMNRAGRMAARAAVCLAAFIGMASPAAAQDDNRTLSVSVGELEYTVKEQPTSKTGKVLGAVIDALTEQMHREQPGYTSAVRSSVITALGNVRRFQGDRRSAGGIPVKVQEVDSITFSPPNIDLDALTPLTLEAISDGTITIVSPQIGMKYSKYAMLYDCTGLTNAYVKAAFTTKNYSMSHMFHNVPATCTLHTTSGNAASWDGQFNFSKANGNIKEDWTD